VSRAFEDAPSRRLRKFLSFSAEIARTTLSALKTGSIGVRKEASLPDFFRHAAGYVHRILEGTRPTDLPVERPTKFQLVVNLPWARRGDRGHVPC
jgi:hypothetical protein